MQTHITMRSTNAKVGPIPVTTTESASCPPSCPLSEKGCYAKAGPLAIHWKAVDAGKRGISWDALCDTIAALPDGQLWRHNQAGDLPGAGGVIDGELLGNLVTANQGRRGFTYTHYQPTGSNADAIRDANARGFTVNLSANSMAEADALASLGIAPVVTLLPLGITEKTTTTPAGRTVVRCPAEYRDTRCSDCQICQKSGREFVVGFTAHGTQKKAANLIASA